MIYSKFSYSSQEFAQFLPDFSPIYGLSPKEINLSLSIYLLFPQIFQEDFSSRSMKINGEFHGDEE